MKRMKAVVAAVLTAAMLLPSAGCSSVADLRDEDVFIDALETAAGIDDDEIEIVEETTYRGCDAECIVLAKHGDNIYLYVRFEDDEDGVNLAKDVHETFNDARKSQDFLGTVKAREKKISAYVLFDIEMKDDRDLVFLEADEGMEIYGGVYARQNTYLAAFTVDGSKRDKEKITAFLKEIKYPTL